METKHVDMRESFLCGYLSIQGQNGLVIGICVISMLTCLDATGLTVDHPKLTTYFEGEIIGSKYSFLTRHEDWGSNDAADIQQ
jgi:glucose-induced degradation protein 4